jgi:anti-sigma regulatory factor (Ser/Thr protein kinase)
MTTRPMQKRGFRHGAFFYATDDEFLARTVPFLEEGVSAGEAVLVVLPEPRLQLLRGALGSAEEVELLSMEEAGRNPARLISTLRDVVRATGPDRGVRGLGEPAWEGRSAAQLEECERHEQLLNLAFEEDRTLTLLCLYDTSALDDEVLAGAERSHPYCCDSNGKSASPRFALDAPLDGSLPQPDRPTASLYFGKSDLRMVRQAVSDLARSAGLDPRRNEDLVLAVCECATNSIQHGGGEGGLAIWRDDDELVCDIYDAGRIEDPLVGRERPPGKQVGGRGLWIVNQLCDLVQIRSGEAGTHVRLRMTIDL